MVLRLSLTSRVDMLAALIARLDADLGAGSVKIYSGAMPATPETAPGASVLLVDIPLNTTSFGAPDPGTAVATLAVVPVPEGLPAASGTAAWARVTDESGDVVWDCSVGTSGTPITITSTDVAVGTPVRLTGGTLTMPMS